MWVSRDNGHDNLTLARHSQPHPILILPQVKMACWVNLRLSSPSVPLNPHPHQLKKTCDELNARRIEWRQIDRSSRGVPECSNFSRKLCPCIGFIATRGFGRFQTGQILAVSHGLLVEIFVRSKII